MSRQHFFRGPASGLLRCPPLIVIPKLLCYPQRIHIKEFLLLHMKTGHKQLVY
ncbi:hypothetical protein HMPREF0322_04593 [Desulfitobacterium hafniense DP7]|uniref:Uncharacterized protein n=1 Tax=Desulfitobacterium hafniense DP7 TaxID=537010 RepID=G9XUD4_DESHA|nr:hypothetical protein HMPREF0322_04593 [Desulfitobacterium hafniense DP7]